MDVPDVSPFPAWVSCVNIPNMVQLRSSKMADGKALSSVSSDNEEPEQPRNCRNRAGLLLCQQATFRFLSNFYDFKQLLSNFWGYL